MIKAAAWLKETRTTKLWIIPVCPLCGDTHTHGAGGKDGDHMRMLGDRVPHCVIRPLPANKYELVAIHE